MASAYIGAGIFEQLLLNNAFNPGNDFEEFQTVLDSLGYPQQTRNIAVANGSLQSDQLGYDNGDKLISFAARIGGSNTRADIYLDTYDTQPSKLAVGMNLDLKGTVTRTYKCFWVFTCTQSVAVGAPLPKSRKSPSDAIPFDNTVGGSNLNLTAAVQNLTAFALNNNFTILTSPYYNKQTKQWIPADETNQVTFSFMPTASAIGLPANLTKDELLFVYDSITLITL